jgi:hypothetical protein
MELCGKVTLFSISYKKGKNILLALFGGTKIRTPKKRAHLPADNLFNLKFICRIWFPFLQRSKNNWNSSVRTNYLCGNVYIVFLRCFNAVWHVPVGS